MKQNNYTESTDCNKQNNKPKQQAARKEAHENRSQGSKRKTRNIRKLGGNKKRLAVKKQKEENNDNDSILQGRDHRLQGSRSTNTDCKEVITQPRYLSQGEIRNNED